MSIKINRLEEGHNSYPLVCRRHAETVSPKGDQYVIDEELQHTYMTVPYVEKVISVKNTGDFPTEVSDMARNMKM